MFENEEIKVEKILSKLENKRTVIELCPHCGGIAFLPGLCFPGEKPTTCPLCKGTGRVTTEKFEAVIIRTVPYGLEPNSS